jgi:hypothetical protein
MIFGEEEADVQAFKQKAKGLSEGKVELLTFNSFVPVPKKIQKAGDQEHAWKRANWGCEWEPCETKIEEDLGALITYWFCTPWYPPIAFLKRVSRQWPNLVFVLEYMEISNGLKGLARFKGKKHKDYRVSLF